MFDGVCPENAPVPLSRDLEPKEEGTVGEEQVMKRLLCPFTTCKVRISVSA